MSVALSAVRRAHAATAAHRLERRGEGVRGGQSSVDFEIKAILKCDAQRVQEVRCGGVLGGH